MDAAAQSRGSAPELVRLLEHCQMVGHLTQIEERSARGRLEDALGPELACRLLGALTNGRRRAVLLV
jgi:hypothetical protein